MPLSLLSGLLLPCAVWAISTSYLSLSDSALDKLESKYGVRARDRVVGWRDLLEDLSEVGQMSEQDKLKEANDFFNAIPWVFDPEHWGKEDYWATPIEMLVTNGGDCEDFSIAKYFTLTAAGVDSPKLRITYVKALDYNIAHMVLAYYPTPGGEPLILDNINKTIMPASQRKDLVPVYSFNGDGLWSARSRSLNSQGNPMKSLPQWSKIHQRIQAELR